MPNEERENRRVLYHYTDRAGYNSIRATVESCFKAARPRRRDSDHPCAAYFTTLEPLTKNLAVKISVPTKKLEYVFVSEDVGDLTPLRGERGDWILYSLEDYLVAEERQIDHGEVQALGIRRLSDVRRQS